VPHVRKIPAARRVCDVEDVTIRRLSPTEGITGLALVVVVALLIYSMVTAY
jgi:hypothetical protein